MAFEIKSRLFPHLSLKVNSFAPDTVKPVINTSSTKYTLPIPTLPLSHESRRVQLDFRKFTVSWLHLRYKLFIYKNTAHKNAEHVVIIRYLFLN